MLEFFEDVYAGFLQLLLQLYIFAITFDFERNNFKKDIFRMFPLLNKFGLKAILNLYFIVLGEVIVSGMSIISLLIALRRRDDEKLMGNFQTPKMAYFQQISFFDRVSIICWLGINVHLQNSVVGNHANLHE